MTAAPGRPVALVTGGARGIGRAIARDVARDHDFVITWLSTAPQDLPDGVVALQADLRGANTPAEVIDTVIARTGRLDLIVNNAGLMSPAGMQDYPAAALQDMFTVNLLAAQGLLAAALPHLKPGACIVSVSSVNAVLPPRGAALFGASKAALETWTRGCAKELGAQGIRVNAVAPGALNIPEAPRDAALTALFEGMTALGRLAAPQDIADAVRFLSSAQARSITGEVLTVSGGYRL